MLRRQFIGSCAAGMLAAGAAAGAQSSAPADGNDKLLALAAVIVPDCDPALWAAGSEAALSLERAWETLEEGARAAVLELVARLDERAGGQFERLEPQTRTGILREVLGGRPADWPEGFRVLRSLTVRALYDSPAGLERAGYIPCTQFAGYPGFDRYPAGRGD